MKMKRYYIRYYDGFSNVYDLVSVADANDESALAKLGGEWGRITYRQAAEKIRREKDARRYNCAFSGYGAISIVPASVMIEGQGCPPV